MDKFTVRFLDDGKFNALSLVNPRYRNTKDDLGFADMVTKQIFVRKSDIPLMEQFVLNHEIEEILAKNSEHSDEFNIRHKKGGAARFIVPAILGVLSGGLGLPALLGTAISGVAGAGMGARAGAKHPEQLGGAGMGALTGGITGALSGMGGQAIGAGAVKGATAAAPGFLSKAGGAVRGALGFAPAPTAGGPLTQAFQASQATNPALASPVTFGGQQFGITGGINRGLTAAALPAAGALGFGAGTLASAGNIPAAQTLNFVPKTGVEAALPAGRNVSFGGQQYDFSQGLTAVPKTGPEAALPTGMGTTGPGATTGVGELTKQAAKKTIWDTLGLKKEDIVRTALGASIPMVGSMFSPGAEPFTPEQSQLFQETANMVRSGAQVQLTPAQTQAISAQYDTALEQARQNIMDRYKMLRPGSDIENDSNFREALIELETDFAEKKANALASMQLGLSAQQAQMMGELANMEIGVLAQKAGISYAESRDFKNLLAQLGYMVSTAGQPIIYTNR